MAIQNRMQYNLDNTRFIFRTNFSGDPKRDTGKYPNDKRKVNIVIPSVDQAKDMQKDGIEVQVFQPKPRNEGDPMPDPIYYVKAFLQYWTKDGQPVRFPPHVYLVRPTGGNPVELKEETVGQLDEIRVRNVNATVRPYVWDPVGNRKSLRIQTIYVEQDLDTDPYASLYWHRDDEDDEF